MILLALTFILSVFFVPASVLIRPDYFIVSLIALSGLISHRNPIFKLASIETKLFLMLSFFAIISLGRQVLSLSVSPRDFMVIVRYVVYLQTVYAGISIGIKAKKLGALKFCVFMLIVVSVVVSFIQYFNIGGLNSIIIPIYGFENKYEILQSDASWRRIIGTMGNPNYWGFMLGVGFIVSFTMFFQRKYMYAVPALLLFVSIIMTGSRTALIAAILTAVLGLFLTAGGERKLSTKKIVVLFGGGVIFIMLYFAYNIFTENYFDNQDRFSTSNLHTLDLRMQWWGEILSNMLQHPHTFFIGNGPSKLDSIRHGDNMYIRYLRDFGIFSLSIYLSLFYQITKKIRAVSRDKQTKFKVFSTVLFLVFMLLFIFDMAADGWFNVRIAEILLFSYGLLLGVWYRERREKNI